MKINAPPKNSKHLVNKLLAKRVQAGKVQSMTVEDEAREILKVTDHNGAQAIAILERQLFVIYQRAQVLVGLAGAIITVTGFSGRLIAGTNLPAQVLLIAGLLLVVLSAIWVLFRVMGVRWVTSELGGGLEPALARILERRNRKTRAFQFGGAMLCLGVILYAAAISIMLLNPEPMLLPVR